MKKILVTLKDIVVTFLEVLMNPRGDTARKFWGTEEPPSKVDLDRF